ncbi:glycosyltransferase family 4 protein [Pseudohoeflea sp. DP4N28-3]|uniref:Glycosyltransferase family 4 protein n=2 Tax=Pseudohoeflea coraliihabitans TaxID=2860393 RepID=A0ABS6WJB5_9HYPH|nr:glycosyltransferase family 4 protein [Pseudohoeflea sp. DP4N28-3]
MCDVIGKEHRLFETIFLKRIDLCHIFWREDLFYLLQPAIIDRAARHLGYDYATLVRAVNSCAFTTSIYDHLFSASAELQERRSRFVTIDGYTVSSRKLQAIYEAEPDLPAPDLVIHDGVDIEHFSPRDTIPPEPQTFAIGWAGNSAWGRQNQGWDVKGYHRLFRPMMDALTERGLAVEARVADPQINRIRFEEMPDFYRDLDVFVCTSAMEGTPNTVLEAMACGVPVISTDVGIVPEAFGDLQTSLIIADPSPERLADCIAGLLQDRDRRLSLRQENRQRALNWSWEIKTREWWPFWQQVMARSMEPRTAIRREIYLRAMALQGARPPVANIV